MNAAPLTTQPSPRLPKEQLLTLIRTLSGVQVAWRTSKRGLLGQRPGTETAWILVSAQSYVAIGVDDLRRTWNPLTNENDALLVGQRAFTLNLQAFSIDTSLQAFDLLERVAFRMRTTTARSLMVPTVALRTIQAITDLDDIVAPSGHIVLHATMDIRMLSVVGAELDDPGASSIIETAEIPNPVVGTNLIP